MRIDFDKIDWPLPWYIDAGNVSIEHHHTGPEHEKVTLRLGFVNIHMSQHEADGIGRNLAALSGVTPNSGLDRAMDIVTQMFNSTTTEQVPTIQQLVPRLATALYDVVAYLKDQERTSPHDPTYIDPASPPFSSPG